MTPCHHSCPTLALPHDILWHAPLLRLASFCESAAFTTSTTSPCSHDSIIPTCCYSPLGAAPAAPTPPPKPALRTNPRARAPAHHTGTTVPHPGPLHPGPTSEPPTTSGVPQHSPPGLPLGSHGTPGGQAPTALNTFAIFRSGFALLCARFEIGCCLFAWSILAESRLYPTPPPGADPCDRYAWFCFCGYA